MRISVVSGVGIGHTELAAFDAALGTAGISNYNLVTLSSIIPPGATIVTDGDHKEEDSDFGKIARVVLAEIRSSRTGDSLAAGLGWYQWGDGRGVFAEHVAVASNCAAATLEGELRIIIISTIRDLCDFRGVAFDEQLLGCAIASTVVLEEPACVLAAALYSVKSF